MAASAVDKVVKVLSAPLSLDEIEWKPARDPVKTASGAVLQVLPYINAIVAKNRLDQAAGPDGWAATFTPVTMGQNHGFICGLRIRIGDEWIEKQGVGAVTDIEPVKGGASDSFKRACVHWGMGRELYDLGEFYVPVLQSGDRFIKTRDGSVRGYWSPPGDLAPSTFQEAAGATTVGGGSQRSSEPQKAASEPQAAPQPPQERDGPGAFMGIPLGDACRGWQCGNIWPCEDHPICPVCGSQMWDNREHSRGGKGKFPKSNPKQPDFKCRKKECDGVWWTGEWQQRVADNLPPADFDEIAGKALGMPEGAVEVPEEEMPF